MKNTLKNKKLFVFDQDGTIYLGAKVFDYAIEFINNLRKNGYKVLFFTNNASHNPDFYYEKLTRMGFEPSRNEILTAGDVTIQFLKRNRAGQKCYLVGTPELETQFVNSGIELSEEAPIVVTSFDTTLTYAKLDTACRLVRNGAEYISTHPDFNCPTEDGFIPDSGAISAFVTASTGVTPTYFGKPYKSALDMMCQITETAPEDMVIFGDRLYTDIALGKRNGVTSVLVLSGETKQNDVDNADEADKPDFVAPSLLEVNDIMFN
ncbi:MAG: HAD-IIA family hydrolase [Clostridia bacterium]|nr:HAD-IIA family hydrolase [Clostridia bacterium]